MLTLTGRYVRDKLGNEISELRVEIRDVRDKLGSEIGALRGEVAKTSTSVARLEGHAFGDDRYS